MDNEKMKRVSKKIPCSVCEKPDWCLVAQDGSAAICARIESGSVKRCGDAGWLHQLRKIPNWQRQPKRISIRTEQSCDLTQLAGEFQAQAEKQGMMEVLAKQLQVSAGSLLRLKVGWCARESCWTFPLRDAQGRVVGLNRRFADGRKRIFSGHKAGLYLPVDLPDDMQEMTLLVVEGGSDTAAGLDLDFWAVGRFSCTHGTKLLRKLIKQRRPEQVVIVADADDPGQHGAKRLICQLKPYTPNLRILTPPVKDLREWIRNGADHSALDRLIRKSSPVKLIVTTEDVRHGY